MSRVVLALLIFNLICGCVFTDKSTCEKPKWFKCDNGRCIQYVFECDGDDDCGDFSDEKNCTGFELPTDATCQDDEFQCLDKMCIPEEWVCNGEDDCLDGSDEVLGCTKHKECDGFQCNNGYCIMNEWRCDGSNDCMDNSDELNCVNNSVPIEDCNNKNDYYLCKNKNCISLKNVCDKKNDCADNSDEDLVGCANADKLCSSKGCSHFCRRTPRGPECSCPMGYELQINRTCVDIDECATYGICDQGCENLEGTYTCTCTKGYVLRSDKKSCKSNVGEALMIFSSKTDIRGYYIESEIYFSVARGLQHVVGVSLDANYIYWSDIQLGDEAIVRSKEDGSEREVIITADVPSTILTAFTQTDRNVLRLGAPEDIALDWVTGNLYFTDSQMKHIGVCNNNGSICTVVVSEYADKPRGIALLPSKGEMYWSDWGENPHISKAGMDGKDRISFIKDNIAWPNGLTIDYPNERLYWVDAKLRTIESIRLDGTDRRIVLTEVAKHPYSIAIFENKLYWSDWKTNSIQSCNKFSGKEHHTLIKEKQSVYGIHIYHSTLKPQISNPCDHQFCSDICLLAPNGTYACHCPLDKELSIDGHTCKVISKQNVILVGAGHMFMEFKHEMLGKPKITATLTLQHITGLAYDSISGTVLASDYLKNVIFRYDTSSGETKNIIETNKGHVGGMDFDHLGNNLYWCDTQRKTIEVYSLNTGEKSLLISLEEEPQDVALIPEYGILYVVLQSMGHIHIDKMQMDGLGSRTHVIETSLLGPKVTLAYDQQLGRIFWADQGTGSIESTSLEGTDRHVFRSGLSGPVSLAILGQDVFWTNYGSRRLYWADKMNSIPGNKKITLGVADDLEAMQLVPLRGIFKEIQHECHNNNGGCSHVCLVVSTIHHMCSCPSGMILDSDDRTCKVDTNCKQYEMKCTSGGSCIEKSKRCDGIHDCPDGEDEKNCQAKPYCGRHQFTCKNGECVNINHRCDSNYDCTDRSDEEDCDKKTCAANEFQCHQGDCVSKFSVCDGRDDCPDSSDEENCGKHTCDSSSFACQSGGCIPKYWECDGQIDCGDGSDEHEKCKTITCQPDMFACDNGRCVDTTLVCNTIDDCGDNSDERLCMDEKKNFHACTEDEFRCYGTNTCISKDSRCNGIQDCPKNDDELLCTQCENTEFTCANKKCIPLMWVCDKMNDCGDGSDELNCDSPRSEKKNDTDTIHCQQYKCLSGSCLQFTSVCNGVADCYDGSDEGGKCATSCQTINPCEAVCHKTPSGPVCDCPVGYRLRGDGLSCEDINECDSNVCAQICRNQPGSFSCSCFEGYVLRGDRISCKVDGPPMDIIIATKDDIRKITQSLNSVEVIYSEPNIGINGIDVNVERNMIYWSTEVTGTINQLSLDTKKRNVVTTIGKPGVLSVDWATDNVYFYDNESPPSIKVCNLEAQKCAKVTNIETATTVKAVTVDPKHGSLYWGQTSWWMFNNPSSEIYRSDLTGSNLTVIASQNLGIVSGIAIDHLRLHLYWADAHLQVIERSDFSGGNRELVMKSNVHRPFGLSLFEDSLFWLTPGTGQLTSCALLGKNKICRKVQISSSHNEEHFTISQYSRQLFVENSCLKNGCSYLCVLKNNNAGCICQDGTTIEEGGTCNNIPEFQPKFGVSTDGIRASNHSDNGIFMGIIITVAVGVVLYTAYYYYQKKKIDLDKYDLSIHFQNPSFGCGNDYVNGPSTLPPGEHEYANPIVGMCPKILHKKDGQIRKSIELMNSDESSASENEDGNYSLDARLIH